MRYSQVILGSRSPRRLELLQLLVPRDRILVRPPRSPVEDDFDGLCDPETIAARLQKIVTTKYQDVKQQLTMHERQTALGIVADTIIVGQQPNGSLSVLGQPPLADAEATVRNWFSRYYSGKTHSAWTGVTLWSPSGILFTEIVKSEVTFREVHPQEIDWYLTTGESLGKAGGYALQGLASIFVSRVEGSLTNVVGLPLEILRPVLAE